MSSRAEQETVILFNEEEKIATVETFNKSMQRKLDMLCKEFPEMFKEVEGRWNVDGCKRYVVPKNNINISKPRVLTEEQRIELSERGKKNLKRNRVSKT